MTEKVRKSGQDKQHEKACSVDTKQDKMTDSVGAKQNEMAGRLGADYFDANVTSSSDRTKHVFVQKKYRDALFRKIFHQKDVLLELYNALSGNHYTDVSELIINTIDDVIYLGYKNDISFIVRGTLNLYEHQGTLNPNMPLRGLIYFGKQYEGYIKQHSLNIYGKRQVMIPFPQYVIFYNGVDPFPSGEDYMELHLSDAFIQSDHEHGKPCLECTARVYNINYGHNKELMKRCRTLEEYSIFISRISGYVREDVPLRNAIDTAVQDCILDHILRDFLLKHRAEVVGMLLEEFDMEEYIRMERRDSYADGLEDGLSKGEAIGLSKGEVIGLSKGEAIGLSKGEVIGKHSERVRLIYTLLKNGISTEQCASLIGEDPGLVAKIYHLSKDHPNWSEDEILQAVSLK